MQPLSKAPTSGHAHESEGPTAKAMKPRGIMKKRPAVIAIADGSQKADEREVRLPSIKRYY